MEQPLNNGRYLMLIKISNYRALEEKILYAIRD